jgi:hypothetical protein
MTPMLEASITMFEIFESYVNAGFSREEALQIVIGIMTHGMGSSQ